MPLPADTGECIRFLIHEGKPRDQAIAICLNKNGSIEKFQDENGRLFVKAFLLDATTNINQWGVTSESLEQNIGSFIGRPLVLLENFDHPATDDLDIRHALAYQELFRVGSIIDVVKHGGIWYGIIEVIDPNAKEAFRSGDVPIYVSPSIAQLDALEPADRISKWMGMHLAVVTRPAFTTRKAMFTGQCGGDPKTCLAQLRKAHVEQHGQGSCGFCVNSAFQQYKILVANHLAATGTSLDFQTNSTSSMADPSSTAAQQPNPQEPAKAGASSIPIEEHKRLQAELEKVKAENEVLKSANTKLKSDSESLSQRIAALENSVRREKIAAVLGEIIPDEKERTAQIEKWMSVPNMTPEDIAGFYKSAGLVPAQQQRKASVTGPAAYDAKLPMRNASSGNDKPVFLALADLIVRGSGGGAD
jgi:hypothetical protein